MRTKTTLSTKILMASYFVAAVVLLSFSFLFVLVGSGFDILGPPAIAITLGAQGLIYFFIATRVKRKPRNGIRFGWYGLVSVIIINTLEGFPLITSAIVLYLLIINIFAYMSLNSNIKNTSN